MKAEDLFNKTRQVLKPIEKISVSKWSEKHFQLSSTSAEPGLWKKNRAPYQVGLMDIICEPGIEKVTIMTAAQIGKSSICNAIIARYIAIDPCPIMFTQPTIHLAQRYSKEKLTPMISDIKVLSEKIVQAERNAASTILMKMFKGGLLCLSGANSPASLASMSIRLLLCDEIDKYPPSAGSEGDPVELAIQRTATFWNKKIVLVSTPSIKGISRIENSYEKSDKRLYFVPCPHCGHRQHLIWERLEYQGKGTDDYKPEHGIYYICETCETPIPEHFKPRMIADGQWIATRKSDNSNHAGFHCNRLISPWSSWIDIAYDYEASKNDPLQLQVFVNSSLGLAYERSEGESLEWEKLYLRSIESNYDRGSIPMPALLLTAGVDVQGDRLEVSIWGWGRNEQSWLIDHHVLIGDPLHDQVWQQLDHILLTEYQHESGKPIRIKTTCVDTGYLTQDVYMQVRKRRSMNVFGVKGKAGKYTMYLSRPTNIEVNYRGKVIPGGVKLYILAVDLGKEILFNRCKITTPGDKYINFPRGIDSNYFEGFCSEVQVKKHKAGQSYYAWEKIPGIHNNEPLDVALYSMGAAHLAGVTRIRWSKLEKEYTVDDANDNIDDISKKEIMTDKNVTEKKTTDIKKTKRFNHHNNWVLNGRKW